MAEKYLTKGTITDQEIKGRLLSVESDVENISLSIEGTTATLKVGDVTVTFTAAEA